MLALKGIVVVVTFMLINDSVVFCVEITNKYQPDSNHLIKRWYRSLDARQFHYGCAPSPYVNLNSSMSATNKSVSEAYKLLKSDKYLFAIYTLEPVSILFSTNSINLHRDEKLLPKNETIFNITLGINENKMASLNVRIHDINQNVTATDVPLLPTIPFYVIVAINKTNILINEANTWVITKPFLNFTFTNTTFTGDGELIFFVQFEHSAPIIADYDCCEACSPWVYTRLSVCSRYSAHTANLRLESSLSVSNRTHSEATLGLIFSENIVINHDGSPNFAAKIVLSETENAKGHRYEISLSDTPMILHYYNKSQTDNFTLQDYELADKYVTPFIVNINVTANGVVTLAKPYEEFAFLTYRAKALPPVKVKYMKMLKYYDDSVRYDFYFNCTDTLSFSDRQPADINTTLYPKIEEYTSRKFFATKYDVTHIFRDFYYVYDKSLNAISAVNANIDSEDDDVVENISTNSVGADKGEDVEDSTFKFIKKGIAAGASCLLIGILKMLFSMEWVRNMLNQVDVDDEKAKEMRHRMSKVFGSKVVDHLGFDD